MAATNKSLAPMNKAQGVGKATKKCWAYAAALRNYVNAGGLVSCGSDLASEFRSAAGYVDRILRGEKPRLTLAIEKARVPKERSASRKPSVAVSGGWIGTNPVTRPADCLRPACPARSRRRS
jgi:hypothetical protein